MYLQIRAKTTFFVVDYAAGERIKGIFRVCQKPANLCHPAQQCILMGEGVYTNT